MAEDGIAPMTRTEKMRQRRAFVRESRMTSGRCTVCGRDLITLSDGYDCLDCRRKIEVRMRALREARERKRLQARRAASVAPGAAPRCGHCESLDLVRDGRHAERQRYRCHACGRRSFGFVQPRQDWPCPYCGKQCQAYGKSRRKQRRFFCTSCRRTNTALWPVDYASPGGPFRHNRTFYLGPRAKQSLLDYCQAHTMSIPQSVRAIFWKADDQPMVKWAFTRRIADDDWGEPRYSTCSARRVDDPSLSVEQRFPDIRSAVSRSRMQRSGDLKMLPSVYTCLKVSVRLDDKALMGLMRTMKARGMNHQDAARALIAEARPASSGLHPEISYPDTETYLSRDIREHREKSRPKPSPG